MKKGKTLTELAQELERITQNSKDYIVPTERMAMTVHDPDKTGEGTPVIEFGNGNGDDKKHIVTPNRWAHTQIASYTDIPQKYYERLAAEKPALLADNVNHGFIRRVGRGDARMVRTVDGTLRAFLSSRYRRLDSSDLLEAVLPTLIDRKFNVISAEYTEQRIYLKAVSDKLQMEVKQGDPVQYGLVISSSDVGAGSLRVEPLIYRLVCLNGQIMASAIRKRHLGKDQGMQEAYELFTDKTKELTDAAFWSQVKDVVTNSMSEEFFRQEVVKLQEASRDRITNFDIPEVVELASKAVGITGERIKQNIVGYLANGADGAGLTKWGLINGITYAAQQDDVDYDSSIELERTASRVLELPRKQWARIAEKH